MVSHSCQQLLVVGILAVTLSLQAVCVAGDGAEGPLRSAKSGLPIIAGVQKAGRTFNCKTAAGGLMQPFNYTYTKEQVWWSGKMAYMVPDQFVLAEVDSTQTEKAHTVSTTFDLALDVFISWHVVYGIVPTPAFFLAYINARQLADIKFQLDLGAKYFGWSTYTRRVYQLNTLPPRQLSLSPQFRRVVSLLPPALNTSSAKVAYAEFMQQVGTHYVCRGVFGGRASQLTFIDLDFATKFGLAASAHEMGLIFLTDFFDLAAAAFATKSDISVPKDFMLESERKNYFDGGDPALQGPWTSLLWMDTIPDQAALVESTLCPLPDLLWEFPEQQAALAEAMQTLL